MGEKYSNALPPMPPSPWRQDAACKNYPPEWWVVPTQPKVAIAICQICPVLEDCYRDHRRSKLPLVGVWAGRLWVAAKNGRRAVEASTKTANRFELSALMDGIK